MKKLLKFKEEKHEQKIKQCEDRYDKIKMEYETTIPFYPLLEKTKSMSLKLYVEKKILIRDITLTVDIINTRKNIQDRLFYNNVVNFAEAVLNYDNNRHFHKNLIQMNEQRFQLSHTYQQKCLEQGNLN